MRVLLCLLLVGATSAKLAPASTLHKPTALSKVSTGGATKKRPASEQLTPSETVLAGACARLVAQTILHPLDVIRTRSQTKNPIEATLVEEPRPRRSLSKRISDRMRGRL